MPSIHRALLFTLPVAVFAAQHDCANIVTDGKKFNLENLGGTKTLHKLEWEQPAIQNTTFTLDFCAPIKEDSKTPKDERCSSGTYVCVREYEYRKGEELLRSVGEIAGSYASTNGRALDPKYTRLKGSSDHANAGREGVRVELHGGKRPNTRNGRPQKVIFEFICDKKMSGLEGFESDAEKMDMLVAANNTLSRRTAADDNEDEGDEDDGPDLGNPDEGKALQVDSYNAEGDGEIDVLRLTWKTKLACEDAADDGDEDDEGEGSKKSGSWGFFTWFLIIVFLLAASYIIFGSWLNYNRYGARGWDLIPHGDTIRDIPYIVKDWGQTAADRLRGGPGGRGGYSAV